MAGVGLGRDGAEAAGLESSKAWTSSARVFITNGP